MKRKISMNEPHIVLFLTDMKKYGRSLLKLQDLIFEIRRGKDKYIVLSCEKDGTKKELMLVSLLEIFELPFEVLDIELLEHLFEKI